VKNFKEKYRTDDSLTQFKKRGVVINKSNLLRSFSKILEHYNYLQLLSTMTFNKDWKLFTKYN
jgi:hypothetical protein